MHIHLRCKRSNKKKHRGYFGIWQWKPTTKEGIKQTRQQLSYYYLIYKICIIPLMTPESKDSATKRQLPSLQDRNAKLESLHSGPGQREANGTIILHEQKITYIAEIGKPVGTKPSAQPLKRQRQLTMNLAGTTRCTKGFRRTKYIHSCSPKNSSNGIIKTEMKIAIKALVLSLNVWVRELHVKC